MKRLLIGFITATLVALGLVGVPVGSASADCPYTGCVPTRTKVAAKSPVKKNHKAKVCVSVSTRGSGKPTGRVTVRVYRSAGGFSWSTTQRYGGGKLCVTSPRLRKTGQYVARGAYHPYPRTVYGPSRNVDTFRVKR